MKFRYKNEIKNRLDEYLKMTRNINIAKDFRCINPNHNDKHPSMTFKNDMIFCSCGWNNRRIEGDIYNVIGLDYGLNTFKEQYEQACKIFGYDDKYNKSDYKKDMKEIKNNYLDIKRIEDQKQQKYNNFCNKLSDKKREFENAMELLSKYKQSVAYLDYKFKCDFIERFLNQIIEYNDESLELVSNFNKLYEVEYNNFKLVLEAI